MKKFEFEIKWGIIFNMTLLVWMILENKLGWHSELIVKEPLYNLLFIPIFIFIYTLALLDKKKNYFNNQMNWQQGFISGIFLSVMVAVLSPLVLYITFTFVSPDFFKNAINAGLNAEHYNINTFVKNSIFDKLSFGVVFSSIISFFIKSKAN